MKWSDLMSQLKTATVLAFERNLDISDGFMAQKNSQNENSGTTPVRIQEKSIRGTISNRLKNTITNDPAKLDAEIEKANLQKVDSASLLEDNDTLVVSWTCKVLPFDGKPNVCNDQAYQAKLLQTVQGYLKEHGVKTLAHRYATNIANTRWLWRNRIGAEKITVSVTCKLADRQQTLTFDAKSISIHNFETQSKELNELADWIEQGLTNQAFIILNITAEAVVGYGQEVYPSQELILDTGKTKSKVLYHINDKAGIHSQKIGNAIRTIDTWYPDAQFPIAVEPYGQVTTMGTAFRQPKQKQDFYSLFDGWILKDNKPSVENQHYVMAVLVRGGVFGASGKES